MTVQEAQQIIDRLCVAFRYDPKDPREFELWIDHLRTVPFQLADEAVWGITRSPRFKFMPKIGEFLGYVDEIHNQGTPNALGVVGPGQSMVDEFGVFRMGKITSLPDDDYWQYCFDEDVRRRFEAQWETEWNRMGGKAS